MAAPAFGGDMLRREFIAGLAGAATLSVAARAQDDERGQPEVASSSSRGPARTASPRRCFRSRHGLDLSALRLAWVTRFFFDATRRVFFWPFAFWLFASLPRLIPLIGRGQILRAREVKLSGPPR